MKDKNAEVQETPKDGAGLIITDSTQAITDLSAIVTEGVAAIKKKYGAIKLVKTDDKEGIELAKLGHSTVKELASKIEKRRVELVAPALEFQRAVNDAAKGIIADLKEVQNHLKGQLDHIEDVKKAEKAEAAAQAAAAYNKKTEALFALGVQYNGNVYSIGSVIIKPDEIRDSTADDFTVILQKAVDEKDRLDQIAAAEEEERERTRQREAQIKAREAELNIKARSIDLKALGAVSDGKQWRLGSVACTIQQVGEETDGSWATILEAMRLEKARQDAAADQNAISARMAKLTNAGATVTGDSVTFADFHYDIATLAPSQMTDLEFADVVTLCQREVSAVATLNARIQRLVSRGAKHENGTVVLGTVSFTVEVIKAANEGAFTGIYDALEAERERLINDREAKRKELLAAKGFVYSEATDCWVLGSMTLNANQVRNSKTDVWKGIGAQIDLHIASIEAERLKAAEKPAEEPKENRIYRTAEDAAKADPREAWKDGYKTCANSVIDAFTTIKSRTEFSAFVNSLINTPQPPDFV